MKIELIAALALTAVLACLATASATATAERPRVIGGGARVAASAVEVVCNDRLAKPAVRVAPTKCTILPPSASFAQGLNLARLRWRGWGGGSATGTGFERGFHLPLSNEPVAVVAYRIVVCPNGRRLYTRFRASSRLGTTNAHAQGCLP
jgi:hypothetical protein